MTDSMTRSQNRPLDRSFPPTPEAAQVAAPARSQDRGALSRWWTVTSLVLVALVVLLAHGPARADAPSRAGRLADLTGAIWLYDAEEREWVQMHRNQSVGEGDRLRATGAGFFGSESP